MDSRESLAPPPQRHQPHHQNHQLPPGMMMPPNTYTTHQPHHFPNNSNTNNNSIVPYDSIQQRFAFDGSDQYGDGSSPPGGFRAAGLSIEPARKKRGRPRKYSPSPDGNIALGLAPAPVTSGGGSGHLESLTDGGSSGGGGSGTPNTDSAAKKHRGRPPGSGKKQMDASGGLFPAKIDYENIRNARISENQARFASLGLQKTISELRLITTPVKSPKRKYVKVDRSSLPLRCSNRLNQTNPNSSNDSISAVRSLKYFPDGSAGVGFTPHVITVKAGEDIASKITAFSQQGPRTVCILSANGAISNVTLRQPAMSGGTVTYEGRFEIISLSGSFLLADSNGNHSSRSSGLSVSLAGSDGRVLGGGVAGSLVAAIPIQVVVGSFITDMKKPKPSSSPLSAPPANMLNFESGPVSGASPPSDGGPSSESSDDSGSSPLHRPPASYNNNASQPQQPPPQQMPMYSNMGWPNSTMNMLRN